ncbi:hypothetical protein EYF80_049699 [Liparis tanakae]|uniref:Uncharacterized protein n=1 Tax=Liparis tanakae TaxID=230148 RepID=A0A4Z2FGU3_9TELE|nr:hypothetical protein EYF80_049699 [Liparis tanakae]
MTSYPGPRALSLKEEVVVEVTFEVPVTFVPAPPGDVERLWCWQQKLQRIVYIPKAEEFFKRHQEWAEPVFSELDDPRIDPRSGDEREAARRPSTERPEVLVEDCLCFSWLSLKKGAPVSEQTEEAQRLKRAAWRAASRRYYARKVARQQANPLRSGPMPVPSHSGPAPFPSRSGPAPFPSHSGPFSSHSGPFSSHSGPAPFSSRAAPAPFPSRPAHFSSRPAHFSSRPSPFSSRPAPFPHMTDSRYAQPVSFADKKRRTLISDLPEASQSLQREAWRAASKRYYARKNARHHQPEPVDYERLLQNMEPPGDPLEPSRGESHGNGEGILCS